MIDPELLPEFVAEAGEHLDEMEANLIKLEMDPDNREIINDIFRDVHTIKGSSAYLGLKVTSELAHKLENLLEMVRQGKRNADSSLIDTLIAAKDRITSLVADIESYKEERTETADLLEAIQSCANNPNPNEKKAGLHTSETNFEKDIEMKATMLDGASFESEQNSILDRTDFDRSQQDNPSGKSQRPALSFSEEEFNLDLDDIFDSEENQSSVPIKTIESPRDTSNASSSIKVESISQSSFSDELDEAEIEESFEEHGDEELFAIYVEQLKINVTGIRELAAQLSLSENRAELLSAITEKIQRLKASANYMGYDKLAGFYERWQAKLETFQDRLFLNDVPSNDILLEEGINSYFDIIQRHFPQLKEIERVQIVGEVPNPVQSQPLSSRISDDSSLSIDNHSQDNTGIIDESLAQDGQGLSPSKSPRPTLSFSEEEFNLDLDGVFDNEEKQGSAQDEKIDSQTDSLQVPASIQEASTPQGSLSDGLVDFEIETSYEEPGDEELFSIYLEQLKINVTGIRELAVQLSLSENRAELLSAISEKIQRLRASSNYMGYYKLFDFYDRWQAKLETFQDRLFLNDAPSCDELIEEGINSYFDRIQRQFPQLQEIGRVPIVGESLKSVRSQSLSPQVSTPSSPVNEVHGQDEAGNLPGSLLLAENEYEENIDTELFSIFLEQLKDNLHAVQILGRQLATSNDIPRIVDVLAEKITRIRGAANYMGYEKLTELYDDWATEIDDFRDPSSFTANGIDLSKRIIDCIKTYTDKVVKIFPQIHEAKPVVVDVIGKVAEVQGPPASVSPANEPESFSSSTKSLLVDRTDELFSLDDSAIEDENDLYQVSETKGKDVNEKDNDKDQKLIDRLSAALDNALGAGIVGESNESLGQLEDIGAEIKPVQKWEDSPPIPEDMPDKETTSPESPKPAELVLPEESVAPALNEGQSAIAPEHEERRKEERRKEDRREATVGSADKVLRQSLRIDANKIDELMNQAGELVINRAWFSQLYNEMRRLEIHLQNIPELDKRDFKQVKGFSFKFHEAIVALGRVANELQESVMKVRMLPISQLFNRYPRLIRDLVHGSDKDIQLVLRGADTELDKMIIEEIADPLIHVIRNAVDHGIEPASTRRAIGKPEKGLLKLDAYHEGSHVVVEVTDDGRGINPEVIKSTALKKGLVNRDQLSRMSPKEITELIMRPGFSTAAQVTRTSGRGVGMDVVRKNLENLNGTIEIESQPGTGTSIRIKIPLTLAVIKALLVKVRNALFTIPLIAVDETLQVRKKDINSIKGNEVIYLRDSTIPLIRVSTIFNLPGRTSSQAIEEEKAYVVIVSAGNSRVGLVVDELRGQEEVVIKPLPDYLRDNKGFSGATILGDGRISLILDIHELVNLTIGRQSRRLSETSRMISEKL